jgi:DNA-binding LacI/PurR family transcriptional regulator
MIRPINPFKTTRKEMLFEQLRDEILSGRWQVGETLPPVSDLMGRFQLGRSTIQAAVLELERLGFVERKHGSGTYIRERPQELVAQDGVVLCMPTSGHLFAEAYSALLEMLHSQGKMPVVADMCHDSAQTMIQRAVNSNAKTLLLVGNIHFPYDLLSNACLATKTVIGILSWENDSLKDRIHRIVFDFDAAVRLVVAHLTARGHKNIVILLTQTMLWYLNNDAIHGNVFRLLVEECRATGLQVDLTTHDVNERLLNTVLNNEPVEVMNVSQAQLVELFSRPDKPTAVFGFMDALVWSARRQLRQVDPALAEATEFIGLHDTPWSQFGDPPFSSVGWDMRSLAAKVLLLMQQVVEQPDLSPQYMTLAPRLQAR